MTDEEEAAARFGEMLRDWRMEAGLSQIDLAARIPTTQAYVSRAENGLELPGLGMMVRFARALGRRLVFYGRRSKLEPELDQTACGDPKIEDTLIHDNA